MAEGGREVSRGEVREGGWERREGERQASKGRKVKDGEGWGRGGVRIKITQPVYRTLVKDRTCSATTRI